MDFEMFLRELQTARARSDRLQQRVDANGGVSAGEALADLQTTLEELRVIEEELRVQNEQLTGLYVIDADRDRWQDLFEHAPVALLLTDPVGIIREVNRRGVVLLRTPRSFLVGWPLVGYVEERWAFRDQLRRLGEGDAAEWTLRLRPRGSGLLEVLVVAAPVRGGGGAVTALRWALHPVIAPPGPG